MGVIGSADGPTAILVSAGIQDDQMLVAIALTLIVGAALWLFLRHK